LTAADGPTVLGSPDGRGTQRHTFHLHCWVQFQAECPVVQAFAEAWQHTAGGTERGATGRAA
jgi:hypothetical protein